MSLRSRTGLAVLSLLLLLPAAHGQGLAKLDSSLKEIPADAAYYSASFRMKEQYDLLVKSKAWAKLTGLPTLQQYWQLGETLLSQPDGPLDRWKQFQKDPENKQLVELLCDMASSEVFLYGGAAWPDFAELLMDVQGSRVGAQITRAIGAAQGKDQNQIMARMVLEALSQHPERIQVPEVIVGFRISNPKLAENQLGRLEKHLMAEAEKTPEMKGRLKRQKVAGGDFLTLALDGKLVPWDQVPFENFEEKPGEFKPLVKKLQAVTMSVSLGVRGNYVLLALGGSTEHLAKLGQGKKLIDLTELQPLAKFADRKLTSINYVSKAMASKVAASAKDIDELVKDADELLKLADLKPAQIARIKKDLEALAKEIKAALPEPGAALAFSFLSDRGYEGYSYSWAKDFTSDASKPLTLLNHVGGNPLFAVVGRSKTSPDEWTKFVRWVKTAHGYFEELGVPRMNAKEQDQYKEAMKAFLPLLRRFDEAMTKLILPALSDGQNGFVLDGKLSSKQWFPMLPPADKPLPILEPALIMGVSDADKLAQGADEVRKIINQIILEVRKLEPNSQVPEFQIPAPKQMKLKAGTGYAWSLPAELGLESKVAPSAGMTNNVAAIGISMGHVERLLVATPLKVSGGPLADSKRPLSAAVYFDWAGCIDTLRPWVDYGLALAGPQVPAEEIRAVLDILQCFRGHTSATYLEGGVTVTHSEEVFQDLK